MTGPKCPPLKIMHVVFHWKRESMERREEWRRKLIIKNVRFDIPQSNYFDYDDEYGEARTELAAGTPILLDHALTHPLTCSIQ
jgi:hypothetical protein